PEAEAGHPEIHSTTHGGAMPFRPLAIWLLTGLLLAPYLTSRVRGDEPKRDSVPVKERVPGLLKALSGAKASDREDAARALCDLGAAAPEAAPALSKALEDSSPYVRLYAAAALIQIDQAHSKKALPVIVAFFKDPQAVTAEGLVICGKLRPVHKDLIAG